MQTRITRSPEGASAFHPSWGARPTNCRSAETSVKPTQVAKIRRVEKSAKCPVRRTVGSRSTEGAITIKTTITNNSQAIARFGLIVVWLSTRSTLIPRNGRSFQTVKRADNSHVKPGCVSDAGSWHRGLACPPGRSNDQRSRHQPFQVLIEPALLLSSPKFAHSGSVFARHPAAPWST